MFGNNSQMRLKQKFQSNLIEQEYQRSIRLNKTNPLKKLDEQTEVVSSPTRSPVQRLEKLLFSPEKLHLKKTQSRRTYKVLTYESGLGKDKLSTEYSEIGDGSLIFRTPGQGKVVNKNLLLYDTPEAAMSGSSSIIGSGRLLRALIAFDSWGVVKRRVGDYPSSVYEFAVVVRIMETLDHAKIG